MKKIIKKLIRLIFTPFVLLDYFKFVKLDTDRRFSLRLGDFYPQIKDKTITTGFDRHYVYHTAWALRKVLALKPVRHMDISSSLYFSGMLSAVLPVDFYDYRPPQLELDNLRVGSVDLLQLPFPDNSIKSLSCLHTIEHIGLGRYGDKLDPDGDLKAMRELSRVTASGGSLFLVVPVGKPRIEFNAHRIYSFEQVLENFKDFSLKESALIPEKSGGLIINPSAEIVQQEKYACGCFWLIKR